MEDCVFCKIVRGEIPSYKVYEDDEFLAFLDINPNMRGQTIVIPKKHVKSYVFDMREDEYEKFLRVVKKVSKLLDESLGVKRCAMIIEGTGINHAHIKLYPLHGLRDKDETVWNTEKRVFFEKYEGYVTTLLGPRADSETLKKIEKEIREKTNPN